MILSREMNPPPFTFDDWGWVVLSVGMGIGAGIAFAPIPVSICGMWVFLTVAAVGYTGIFVFQNLFIDVMGADEENLPYTDFMKRHLGPAWGEAAGLLYTLMLFIWFFVYTEAIVKDSASYLVSFGLITTNLSGNPLYVAGLVALLVAVAAGGEKLLFKIGSVLTLTIMATIFLLGAMMIPEWDMANIPPPPSAGIFARNGIWLLPFVLTSILFLQSLSPMVVWFRDNSDTSAEGIYRAQRAHFMAFGILFAVVFFYIVSFVLSLTPAQGKMAFDDNISALALLAKVRPGPFLNILELVLELFAVATSFFAVYLSLKESLYSQAARYWKNNRPGAAVTAEMANRIIAPLLAALGVAMVLANAPILMFTALCSPIFGIVGCLIPARLVYALPQLAPHRGPKTVFVIVVGILLCMAPLADYLVRSQLH